MAISKVTKSEFGKLDRKDWWKGLWMAAFTGLSAAALELVTTGFTFDLNTLQYLVGGALAGIAAYLSKNTVTNSEDKMFKKETRKAKRVAKRLAKKIK